MSFVSAAVGIGAAGIGLIGKSIARGQANRTLGRLQQQNPIYQQNPYAGKQLATANQFLYGRMAGAPQLERNIFSNEANQFGNINRNATDSSQALALGAAAQGQTDASLQGLQTREQQNKYAMLGNLNQAYGGMINEGNKQFQDQTRRFGDLAQIQGAQAENRQNMWQDVSNFGLGIADVGMNKGFTGGFGGNMFRGNRNGNMGGGGGNSYNPMNGI